MMSLVNQIEIPYKYRHLCDNWYDGQNDLMYAIASTGGLTLGRIKPLDCETDEEWYLSLWQGLSTDVARARKTCEKWAKAPDDVELLQEFEEWVDSIVEFLDRPNIKYNGIEVHHRDINADYVLLVAGVDGSDVSYQAYAKKQLTHRLWTIPQSSSAVDGFLRTGLISIVDEVLLTDEMGVDG